MGQLVQLDASPFAWFGARGPQATLHGLIDDASSRPVALWFRPTEDLHGYLTVLGQTCRAFGVPITLYGEDPEKVKTAMATTLATMAELERDFGPYMHPRFLAHITNDADGGMEYAGAARTSLKALKHELTHSWFGRGVHAANGKSGWIDEADLAPPPPEDEEGTAEETELGAAPTPNDANAS